MRYSATRSGAAKLVFLFFIIHTAAMAQPEEVYYELSMPEPHTHYFEVDLKIAGDLQDTLDFKMPVWTPGSYLVREFARNVEAFQAFGPNGQQLQVRKTNKNTWRVFSGDAMEVSVSYRVYAFERSVRTSFVDASHAFVMGTSVFMFAEGYQDLPVRLKVNPYEEWNKVSSGLQAADEANHVYTAPNYDVFVDSPFEIGNHDIFSFKAAGVDHDVAMYGRAAYDEERLKTDMAKIAEASTAIFGDNPNDYYLFIIHNLDERGGGLEHLNSTVLHVDRWAYTSENAYSGFLSLAAHEYFHLWWVKRARPIALGPFDYDSENYTRQLWVMEGFTSYYDELLLRRIGRYSEQDYLRKLSGTIGYIENQPGEEVQPVAQASFDAWIKAYRPDENSQNTSISYYSKGAVLAALLDLEILHATGGKRRLDDVLKHLYETYYKENERGFTEEEFKTAVEEFAGHSLDDFFNDYVYGTADIDYNKYFQYAGLQLVDLNEGTEQALLGIDATESNGRLKVKRVMRGTAAYEGGLNAGDEIIAVDGYRVGQDLMNEIVALHKPGDKLTFTVSREGLIKELEVALQASHLKRPTLIELANPTAAQRKIYGRWLEQ